MAVNFPGDRQFERLTNLPSSTTSFTAMAWVKSDDNSPYPVIFDFGPDDATGLSLEFFISGTTGGIWNGTTYAYGGTINTGTWYHVALSCSGTGATDLKGYVDGVNVSSMTGASHSTAIFTIGAWPGNFQKFDGKMAGFKLFDSVLTTAQIQQEMRSLRVVTSHSNLKAWLPWINNSNFTYDLSGNGSWAEQGTGSFTSAQGPPVSWGAPIPFTRTVTAAGAFTLVGDSGTYTYTGTSANLNLGRSLVADSGSYTYIGTAAALNLGRPLVADSGSYTYSGTAADLKAGYNLAGASGAYTYTGTAADLKAGYNLSADSGTYNYTGTDAALTFGSVGAFTLVSDSGSYTYTGTDASLKAGYNLSSDSGSYSYTGTTVSFLVGYVINAETGSYVYTGTSIALTANLNTIWTVQSDESTSWAVQADQSTTWTAQPDQSTTWTVQ